MSNFIYDKAAAALWGGLVDWDTANVKAVLLDTADYTVDKVNDEFLSDIPVAARVSTSPNLTNAVINGRVIDADDTTFSAVTGDESEAVALFIDTGSSATSRLLIYVDSATNLPVTPNGLDIEVRWNASGIATL